MITLLTSSRFADRLAPYLGAPTIALDLSQLSGGACLIAFNTGVVVTREILSRFDRAYNFHAASPNYPGRDPHHWAIYDGTNTFGVTCHMMTERVDAGAIVAVREFPIEEQNPKHLRQRAETELVELFTEWAPKLVQGDVGASDRKWSGTKRRRADLLAMLDIRGVSADEKNRRLRAFEGFAFRKDGD